MLYGTRNCMSEWSITSGKAYTDPFNEVEIDVIFSDPEGTKHVVPAFWAGEQAWRVRYAPPTVGPHRYRTVCSDASNPDLHGKEGTLQVAPYEGTNPLLRHGPLQVAAGTSSTATARPFSGSATPGGWASAGG